MSLEEQSRNSYHIYEWDTSFNGAALIVLKSRWESNSSSNSPISALKKKSKKWAIITSWTIYSQANKQDFYYLHIISTNDIQAQRILFNTFIFSKDTFMTLLQYDVDGLVEAFQVALRDIKKSREVETFFSFQNSNQERKLTTIFLPSLVMTLTVSEIEE